jgi:hypothetical protein
LITTVLDKFIMEYGSHAHGIGLSVSHHIINMAYLSRTPARYDGDGNCLGNLSRQFKIKPLACPLPVYRCHHKLAGPECCGLKSPFICVDSRALPTIISISLIIAARLFLSFDGNDYGGGPEATGGLTNQFGTPYGGCVNGNLVGSRSKNIPDVIDASQAAGHGERNKDLLGSSMNDIE